MVDASIISPEARRFISTAAGISSDSVEFSVSIKYIQNPVAPIDRNNEVGLRDVLRAGWKAEILSPLETMLQTINSSERLNHSAFSDEERELWNKAVRVRMIWGFEHSTGEDKAKFVQALESLA